MDMSAVLDTPNSVGDLFGQFFVMFNHDHGRVLCLDGVPYGFHDDLYVVVVQFTKEFVGQDKFWSLRYGFCRRNPTLLPT